MANRNNDPFNFSDIYKQAGVEDLFVKKTMGEMKKSTNQPTPPPKPTPVANLQGKQLSQPAFQSNSTSQYAGRTAGNTAAYSSQTFDLDFLAQPSASSVTTRQPAPAATPVDPFAAFESVEGVLPPEPSPPVSHKPTPLSSSNNLLGLEDHEDFAPPSPPVQSPSPPPPPPAAPTPPPPEAQPHQQPAAPVIPSDPPRQSVSTTSSYGSGSPTSAAAQAATQPAASSTFFAQHYDRLQKPAHNTVEQSFYTPAPEEQSRSSDRSASLRPPVLPSLHSSTLVSNKSEDSSKSSGVAGFLKGLGKKAVKVAQAGLQQLESALEKLDNPAKKGYEHEEVSVDSDVALAHAVRLGDLPPYRQEEELAKLDPHLRPYVVQILCEQARSEVEHALGSPRTHHDPRNVMHTSEFRLDDDQPTTHHSPPPPSYHEATQPASYNPPPPPYEYASSHPPPPPPSYEEAVHHPHAHTADRPTTPVTAATPATSHPTSPAPPSPAPLAQSSPAAVDHDLLGVGSASPPSPSPRARAPPAPVDHDLLGFGSGEAPIPSSHSTGPAQPAHDDFLGFGHATASPPASAANASPRPAVVDVDDADDFFAGPSKPSAPSSSTAPSRTTAPSYASASAPATASSHGLGMDDFFAGSSSSSGPKPKATASPASASVLQGLDALGLGADGDLYDDMGPEDPNEPEIRKRLRAQRLADKHAKMQAALAEKLAKDEEETRARQQQVELKEKFKANVESWRNKNKGNIRGLLGTLQTVLWEGSGWQPASMADLLEPNQVKKAYMKANLIVHPDKVRQKNGTAEQVAIADMVFDALKEAWNVFQK